MCLLPRTKKRKALSIFSCFGQKPPKQFYEFFLSFFPLRKKKEKRLLREKKRSDTERRTRQSNATRVRQTKRISSACFCINVTDIDSIGITLYVRLHLITATLYGISLSKLSLSLSLARERATSASTNKDYFAREMYKTLFPLMNASPYLFLSCPLTYSCFIVLNERGRDGEFRYFRSLFKGGKQTQQFCERFY